MKWPTFLSRTYGRAAVVTMIVPKRFVSICARKSDIGVSSTDERLPYPALLITTSSGPWRTHRPGNFSKSTGDRWHRNRWCVLRALIKPVLDILSHRMSAMGKLRQLSSSAELQADSPGKSKRGVLACECLSSSLSGGPANVHCSFSNCFSFCCIIIFCCCLVNLGNKNAICKRMPQGEAPGGWTVLP